MLALQGSIKDFSVADILQLLAQQQKTGILIVEKDARSIEVYFSNGEILDVITPTDNDILGSMLVKSHTVTQEQLEQALEVQQNSVEQICKILQRQGLLSKEAHEHIFTTYAYEVFYEILQWRKGSYRFVVQETASHATVELPGLESILLDVLRMIDEWPEIRKVLNSLDMLFDNNYTDSQDMEADEERICSLVDGKRSVQDIVDAGLLGRFYTCKALVQLLERGAIRLLSGRADAETGRRNIIPQAAASAVSLVGLAAVAAVIVLFPGTLVERLLPVASPELPGSALYRSELHDDMSRIEKALGMYFFRAGEYPDRPSELVTSGIFTTHDLSAFTDHAIVYEKAQGAYELRARP